MTSVQCQFRVVCPINNEVESRLIQNCMLGSYNFHANKFIVPYLFENPKRNCYPPKKTQNM